MSGDLCSRAVERTYSAACIAGVDEAGRGPLAGPVVAAACVWPLDEPPLEGIDDSKALTAERRDALFALISGNPRVGIGVGIVDHQTIDKINILQVRCRARLPALRPSRVSRCASAHSQPPPPLSFSGDHARNAHCG